MRILILTSFFLISPVIAEISFDDFKKDLKAQKQTLSKQQNQEFENHKKQSVDEYENFKKQYLVEFDHYRNDLFSLWKTPIQSTTTRDVIYSKDKQTRVIVDKSKQNITIQTLKPTSSSDEFIDNLKHDEQILNAVLPTMESDNEVLTQIAFQKAKVIKQTAPSGIKQILEQEIIEQHENQLSHIDKNTHLSEKEKTRQVKSIEDSKQQRVKNLEKELRLAKQKSIKYKNITSYSINTPNDYRYKKLSQFINYYKKQANKNDQDLALLLAISEAESSFNPKAKSYIPAFGLMQVVRGSAGLDVNQKIHNKNTSPTENELYTPNINIEYGSNYLKILTQNYLRNIKDPVSRKYCVIAAYNTGAGNVARAFNGFNNLRIADAIPKINAQSSNEVYQTLMSSLPYSATKKYLKTVSELEKKYQKNITNWNI